MTAWILVLVGLAFAVVLVVGLQEHARTFEGSVLKVQLAGSGPALGAVLDRLGPDGRDDLRRSLRVDGRLVVPGWTGVLVACAGLSLVGVRFASDGVLELVGVTAAVLSGLLAVVAGLLDLVENRAVGQALDAWHPSAAPAAPEELEAAVRQHLRRAQVAALDRPSATATLAASWKYRLLAVVLVWLLVAAVVATTAALSR